MIFGTRQGFVLTLFLSLPLFIVIPLLAEDIKFNNRNKAIRFNDISGNGISKSNINENSNGKSKRKSTEKSKRKTTEISKGNINKESSIVIKMPEILILEKIENDSEFEKNNKWTQESFEQVNRDQSVNVDHGLEIKEKPVSINAGFGAKSIDDTYNEIGVPYFNMNKEVDLTQEREIQINGKLNFLNSKKQGEIDRNDSHQEKTNTFLHFESTQDHPLFRIQYSKSNVIKAEKSSSFNKNHEGALIESPNSENRFYIESGNSRDNRLLNFRKAFVNPFDPKEMAIEGHRNYKDQTYLKGLYQSKSSLWLIDSDWESKNIQLGSKVTGFRRSEQYSVGSQYSYNSNLRGITYFKYHGGKYDSTINPIEGNRFKSLQGGGIFKWNLQSNYIEFGLSGESLKRNYYDFSQLQYDRFKVDFLSTYYKTWSGFILKTHFKAQGAQDYTYKKRAYWNSDLEQKSIENVNDSIKEPIAMDVGLDLKSLGLPDKKWNLGFIAKARSFGLLPTPKQKFGDGMSLIGNEDLPLEKGTRFSAGVWYENEGGTKAEIVPFYELTLNEPVIQAISPQSAKTIGVGSVYARGVNFYFKTEAGIWTMDLHYCLQEALNNSKITWQHGHSLPGRPTHTVQSSFSLGSRKGFSVGSKYEFKSEMALDLSGLWKRAPHHNLISFIGYGKKNWHIEVVGSQLLSSLNDVPLSLEQGMVGYDLMNPQIESKEFKLIWELLL